MPAIYRTIVPRLRKSLETRGLIGTLRRSFVAPIHLLREYRDAKANYAPRSTDPFDLTHNVETSQRIHSSDLKVTSPNWDFGYGYWPTSESILRETLAALPVHHEEFTFIDLGSGKGRVLLVASDYPFARIIGVEYAPDLHEAAVKNLRSYRNDSQRCHALESQCGDIADFLFPEIPLVIFLYNPAGEIVLRRVVHNLFASLKQHPRKVWVIYVTPSHGVFERDPLHKVLSGADWAIYSNRSL